ncbi:alpha/beta hydrolase [Streptosporangium sp. NBC_01639]|uniref:alpha/beta hydrolase family protein n=1 Tax=Streptosporangium sp. NBC_01639 TaxID=2975948 RepID=UPI00386C8E82|nr:alpha/beta hydrolase [Streptosporangium sp. NBC_01639]
MSVDPLLYEVTFSNAEVVLAGSLAVPDRHAAPSPGVVMVGGSGPSDRNNDTYFPPIRRHLVNAGIAVLSYDKRGVGASSGEWRDATLDDLATDAVAALNFLRAQPGVRADAVGLFGHSEGGWVVLRATAGQDNAPWVITNSCPGMTPANQDRYALANALRQTVTTQQDIDSTLALYDRLIEAGRSDGDFAEATRLVDSAGRLSGFVDYWADMDERSWEFLKRKQDHDPIPDALRLRCPHLAIFGGADELVPVADSVHLFSAAACNPDRRRRATLAVEVFPGADHRIQTDGGTRLAPGYLTTLTRWIKARTGPNLDT